ncbi:MAG: BatA domain-containing protein, partial [Pseudomonadota bacterium]
MMIGPIGFAAPWLLVALAALPVLWILLRAVPPAPIRRRFPGVALLLGLNDDDTVTDRTPWWLLLLRMLAVAALIIGLAGPVLNPQADPSERRAGPLLIVMDATWASARDWSSKTALIDTMLAEAGREARPAAVLRLSDPEPPVFQSAEVWRTRLTGLTPEPWSPTAADLLEIAATFGDEDFETRWFSDGLARPGREAFLDALEARGPVTIFESPVPIIALAPATVEDSILNLSAARATPGAEREITVEAHGRDPSGAERMLATLPLRFDVGATEATGELALPAELRARLTRFEIGGQFHAGAVTLTDDSLRR